jgi:2,4-dienoyl-CoA reductase (NADPH2)
MDEWGVDMHYETKGGLKNPEPDKAERTIYLLQRSKGKLGERLGKTTGWIHRSSLKNRKVQMIGSVQYHRIDDQGLHISINDVPQVLEVDQVIVCAGQEPMRDLFEPLQSKGINVYLIGGADEARELDAKRAIDQASRMAAKI